jgi:hypothetical protein
MKIISKHLNDQVLQKVPAKVFSIGDESIWRKLVYRLNRK